MILLENDMLNIVTKQEDPVAVHFSQKVSIIAIYLNQLKNKEFSFFDFRKQMNEIFFTFLSFFFL